MKTLRLAGPFLLLVLAGCAEASPPPPPDFPNIASAFKFVGVCSVVASCVWAYAIVKGSDNRRGK